MNYVTRLAAEIAAGRPVAAAKVLSAPDGAEAAMGQALLVGPEGLLQSWIPDPALAEPIAEQAMAMLRDDQSGVRRVPTPAGPVRIYVESTLPPPILLVIGAGHVGQMVAAMGAQAGFAVTVLDDRPEYANAVRFPTAHQVIAGPLAEELSRMELGPRHHLVLMTRGHHQDLTCLRQVIEAPVAYLGMIGSRNRVRTIFEILTDEGVGVDLLERVRAPIGLDIGARTPGEIAIAVLAEVIAARRGGTCAPLSGLGRALVHSGRR